MDMELTAALPSLRDVEGVMASFVLSDEGEVVARDLAAFVDDSALREVAPRLGRFHEALSSTGDFLDLFVLEFGEQALHARRVPNGFLCLITAAQVNGPALRMAVNLMARRVGDRIAQRHGSLPPQTMPVVPPTPTGLPTLTASRPTPPPVPPPLSRSTPTMVQSRTTTTQATAVRPPPTPGPTAPAPSRPMRVYRGQVLKG